MHETNDPFGASANFRSVGLSNTSYVCVQTTRSASVDVTTSCWDNRPPSEICLRWEKYKAELLLLPNIRIPRTIALDGVIRRELHGFCDASERGYEAVAYLRTVTTDKVVIRLLAAKSKVAPLKSVTLPRLELCAAVLLADLMRYVRTIFQDEVAIDATYCWSDSSVTLSWIKSIPHRWKTFVRNRVARIQSHTDIACWGHVDTKSNPADCCSRGLFPQELLDHALWWNGPAWLLTFEPTHETGIKFNDFPDGEEQIQAFATMFDCTLLDSLLDRFSSLDKIVRIIAYCLRFINSLKIQAPRTIAVNQTELHSALLIIVRQVQGRCFTEDIAKLHHTQLCSPALRKLAPFLDSQGVLRVGGRLTHAAMPYEAKHPALLPGKHRLTELIIERAHRVQLYPRRRTLLYILLQNF